MTTTTSQPAIDIDAVPAGPALDVLVAGCVFRYDVRGGPTEAYIDKLQQWSAKDTNRVLISPQHVPLYSTDANHVREVESEIERRGLAEKYVEHLFKILFFNPNNDPPPHRVGCYMERLLAPNPRHARTEVPRGVAGGDGKRR